MYPNPGFNTFNLDQLFKGYKVTPSEGHLLISAKTVKYFGLFCETKVAFNFAPEQTYFQKDYEVYNTESKSIMDKKRVEISGIAVSVNGVVEETSINPARVFFLVGSLYSLFRLVNKLFEYFIFYLHPEKDKFKLAGMKLFDPNYNEDELVEEDSQAISVMT